MAGKDNGRPLTCSSRRTHEPGSVRWGQGHSSVHQAPGACLHPQSPERVQCVGSCLCCSCAVVRSKHRDAGHTFESAFSLHCSFALPMPMRRAWSSTSSRSGDWKYGCSGIKPTPSRAWRSRGFLSKSFAVPLWVWRDPTQPGVSSFLLAPFGPRSPKQALADFETLPR